MKVEWGSIIVAGSGTLGGHVYSRNHYGAFARTKVNPFNPQTGDQQIVRNRFEVIQTSWQSLTSSQQAAWSAASIDYPRTNSFGKVYYLTGYNLFIALNIPFYRNAGSIMTSPPTKNIPTASTDGTLVVDFGGTGLVHTYTTPPNETDVKILCFATRGLSAGITYVSTELRLIRINTANGSNPNNLTSSWGAKFGADPLAGQKVFVRLQPVNVVTGDYGIPFTFAGIQP